MIKQPPQDAVIAIIQRLQRGDNERWVNLASLGKPLNAAGVRYEMKLRAFLETIPSLDFRDERPQGRPPISYVRPRASDKPAASTAPADAAAPAKVTARSNATKKAPSPEPPARDTASRRPILDDPMRDFAPRRSAPASPDTAREYAPRRSAPASPDTAREYAPRRSAPASPDTVRDDAPRRSISPSTTEREDARKRPAMPPAGRSFTTRRPAAAPPVAHASAGFAREDAHPTGERAPSPGAHLIDWATNLTNCIDRLAARAMPERWSFYPDAVPPDYSILKSYLANTFRRLTFEKKIRIVQDPDRPGEAEEYAAFNTGLVDRKYTYIYALFKRNTRDPEVYWYLIDFVVAGEETTGKTLIRLFNPLPERADYFCGQIRNILFDTSAGDLICDYPHIISERVDRLPVEFLKENCPDDFLTIRGKHIDRIAPLSRGDSRRKSWYYALSKEILNNPRIFNRLKSRIEDAVSLAVQRAAWNYKAAVPMYYPPRNCVCFLLPLSLTSDDVVDLALVAEPLSSGSYQGHTILHPRHAYTNSRLIANPESDWLNTQYLSNDSGEDEDEET